MHNEVESRFLLVRRPSGDNNSRNFARSIIIARQLKSVLRSSLKVRLRHAYHPIWLCYRGIPQESWDIRMGHIP